EPHRAALRWAWSFLHQDPAQSMATWLIPVACWWATRYPNACELWALAHTTPTCPKEIRKGLRRRPPDHAPHRQRAPSSAASPGVDSTRLGVWPPTVSGRSATRCSSAPLATGTATINDEADGLFGSQGPQD